jgi:hypothetical protein
MLDEAATARLGGGQELTCIVRQINKTTTNDTISGSKVVANTTLELCVVITSALPRMYYYDFSMFEVCRKQLKSSCATHPTCALPAL